MCFHGNETLTMHQLFSTAVQSATGVMWHWRQSMICTIVDDTSHPLHNELSPVSSEGAKEQRSASIEDGLCLSYYERHDKKDHVPSGLTGPVKYECTCQCTWWLAESLPMCSRRAGSFANISLCKIACFHYVAYAHMPNSLPVCAHEDIIPKLCLFYTIYFVNPQHMGILIRDDISDFRA